jgi:membrane protein implicated in regulation of membrane protease activity
VRERAEFQRFLVKVNGEYWVATDEKNCDSEVIVVSYD